MQRRVEGTQLGHCGSRMLVKQQQGCEPVLKRKKHSSGGWLGSQESRACSSILAHSSCQHAPSQGLGCTACQPCGPLCLPIATLFSSSLFSHISQVLNLDLSYPCQLPSVGATEPAAPSPGDMSEMIYQMHHLHLDMQNLHMFSCRQLPSRQHAGLGLAYGPDFRR